MTYKPQGPPKPGKFGVITAPLNIKNIGIDNKTLMLIDDRVAMAQKMEQEGKLKIGCTVEYKQLTQGVDKGKINFIQPKDSPAAATQPAAAEPPAEKYVPRDPRDIPGKYIGRTSNTITIKQDDLNQVYSADLTLLQYLAKPDTKVTAGTNVTVHLVDSNGTWVAKNIGPGAGDDQFKTGAEILQQNIDQLKEKQAVSDAALEQINKENSDGDARLKEQEDYAKQLMAEKQAKEAAQKATEAVATTPRPEPEKPVQNADTAVPDTLVKSKPIIVKDPPTLEEFAAGLTMPAEPEYAVELSIHVGMESYSNFDLKCPAMPIDKAIVKLEQDAAKVAAMMHRIISKANKGY